MSGLLSGFVADKNKAKASIPRPKAKTPERQPEAKKPISLYYPKPDEMPGKVRMMPPKITLHTQPLDVSLSRPMNAPTKGKEVPYAATAIGGAAVLSGALALFFIYVIKLDWPYGLCLALPFFIGLSILFYNFLEVSERTGK